MKFSGKIGFWNGHEQVKLDVYVPVIEERLYYGDVLSDTRRNQTSNEKVNDDLVLGSRISIISDIYMQQHWPSVKYVIWNDVAWKVTSVDVGFPRITLNLGGVYNGKTKKRTEPDPSPDIGE